ncbi:hypothetical protein vBPaerPsIn_97 [Pseudomonas phage vB_Paer_PsIn]|uniref:Uncharacterized protein n=3 Tax=Pakpunavirus TaxID=1921407 RepID=A0A172EK33_9CAUD|nr:hypothetical protein BIZ94_gp034 [Pseudomonas phage vB_PaeM_MAG1]YP_010765393.1 hypothetical protein QE348_gp097 [Pseudomonas phage vB_Paer_PsIn]ALA12014.1 hypothetical protein vB_PaeM_MAG1_034 [Pseudomonas phage vB_PaeM_MAG1]UOL48125.1 hypothetical protein vBPaerPsIn_97 [Pseudomonas phage vB_Paer_PsIn]CEF89455.1 hypothetical protein [Pseudomonas phage vB_PaeM_C2-10_Ab08]
MGEDKMGADSYWELAIKQVAHGMNIAERERQILIADLISWYERRILHRVKREEYEAI